MITKTMRIVGMIDREIPLCPYCGADPVVDVKICPAEKGSSASVMQTIVQCPHCGICMPLRQWEAIAAAIEQPARETGWRK